MRTVKQLLSGKTRAIYSVDVDDPVLEAIRLMADKRVGALPVLRNGALAGIMSERDYARKVVLLGRSSAETPVSTIMSSPVVTVTSSDTVQHCMEVMTARRIRHLPVVDQGSLIGMVSIGDCVKSIIDEQRAEIEDLKRYIAG
ncbi:MAG: CBS domain-containing protein [Steroidobacteraceae bacterium]